MLRTEVTGEGRRGYFEPIESSTVRREKFFQGKGKKAEKFVRIAVLEYAIQKIDRPRAHEEGSEKKGGCTQSLLGALSVQE